tara:strand:- start:140 stop:334 length:195 start_codon:yes stop_codon:yes gene_type:complete
MDLPIDDKDLATIVEALNPRRSKVSFLIEDTTLYEKLRLVKDVRDANPDAPYKKILRDTYGMVI